MLIYHARILSCDGQTFEDGFLETSGSKIVRLGAMNECPAVSADDFDAQGGWCVPGLIDPHCHVGSGPEAIGTTEYSETLDPIVPQYDAMDAFYPFDMGAAKCVKHGITTIVGGPGSTTLIGGRLGAFKLNGKFAPEACLKRGCAIKFAVGEAPKMTFSGRGPSTRMAIAAMLRDAFDSILDYMHRKEKGDIDRLNPKWEALIPLMKREIPAHVHAMRADDIRVFLELTERYGLRTVIVHGQQTVLLTEELRRLNAGVIHGPLMFTSRDMESDHISFENPIITAKAGVMTTVCTDACPGLGSAQMLPINGSMIIRMGMEPEEALKLFTINAAQAAGIDDRVGSLTVGKDADVAVFDDFPLELTAHTRLVLIDGRRMSV